MATTSRLGPRQIQKLGTQSRLLCEQQLPNHLGHHLLCLELRVSQRIQWETMHSNIGYRSPNSCLKFTKPIHLSLSLGHCSHFFISKFFRVKVISSVNILKFQFSKSYLKGRVGEGGRKAGRERKGELFCFLIHFTNGCICWSWVRLN